MLTENEIMKIAITNDGKGIVAQHFGHCPLFTIAEINGNTLLAKKDIKNPGHEPGFLPKFLYEQGVSIVIAGSMGQRAIDLFNSLGIRVMVGITGTVDEAIDKFMHGNLQGGKNLCDH